MRRGINIALVLASWITCAPAAELEVSSLLVKIKSVGKEGAGNVEASKAWRELVQAGPAALPRILPALDDADETAANWMRTAFDAIAEKELTAGRPLPAAELHSFVLDTSRSGPARRLAYEWLAKIDPSTPARLLPGMLQDPNPELRRDAIARIISDAESKLKKDEKDAAKAGFQKALATALDKDQVDLLAKQLKALGVEVDLATHFGLIRRWKLIGPFDSTGGVGFKAVYPPEEKVDLAATLKGKQDAQVRWIDHETKDPYGIVDLNKAIGKHMGAVAYAYADVDSPAERPIQIRAGSANAVKLFLNGKQIFFREEYHHGMHLDQHVGVGTLKAGRNEVLIKICQNEQKEEWAQNWHFQLRLCDTVGAAVPIRLAFSNPPEGKEKK